MPREFRFGSDPEFVVVRVGPNNTIGELLNASGVFTGGTTGPIGNNGIGTPAELRTLVYPTIEELYSGRDERTILSMLQSALRQARESQHTENIGFLFGSEPVRRVPIGAHIHITSTDMEWYWSKEAIHLLHLFITVPCFMYYKPSVERAAHNDYGNYGNWHPSPDPHQRRSHHVNIPIPGSARTRLGWHGGWTGWEYRAPPSWIGPTPEAERFRGKLFPCINGVMFNTASEKAKQWEFFKDVYERLGLHWYNDLFGADSETVYDRIVKSLRLENDSQYTHAGGREPLMTYFSYRATSREGAGAEAENNRQRAAATVRFKKLIRAMKDAQDTYHLEGFGTLFDDMNPDDPYSTQFNIERLWAGVPRVEIPIPQPAFATVQAAIDALNQSYAAFVESTNKSDWMSNGKAWHGIFPNQFVETDGGVARDIHVDEIAYIAFGLCVDAIQRRVLRTRFWPRTSFQTHIYGGTENRFPSPSDVVALPNDMARHASVRRLLAAENFTAAQGNSPHIFMRMSFRESSSNLRFIITALYLIWTQKYIGGVGPSGTETVAEENPTPLFTRNIAAVGVLG